VSERWQRKFLPVSPGYAIPSRTSKAWQRFARMGPARRPSGRPTRRTEHFPTPARAVRALRIQRILGLAQDRRKPETASPRRRHPLRAHAATIPQGAAGVHPRPRKLFARSRACRALGERPQRSESRGRPRGFTRSAARDERVSTTTLRLGSCLRTMTAKAGWKPVETGYDVAEENETWGGRVTRPKRPGLRALRERPLKRRVRRIGVVVLV